MKKRRNLGPSRNVKGAYASYTELGINQIRRQTHKTQDVERDRMELAQRRESEIRGK